MLALFKGDLSPVSASGFFVLSHGPSFVKVIKRQREREREERHDKRVETPGDNDTGVLTSGGNETQCTATKMAR